MTSVDYAAQLVAALERGADMAVIEHLTAKAEEQDARARVLAFDDAMIRARGSFDTITPTAEGQHATQKGGRKKGWYAPYETITKAVDPALEREGLRYLFTYEERGERLYVVCVVRGYGHEERTLFPYATDDGGAKTAIQKIASGNSYACRYALRNALSLTIEHEDDDGEGGQKGAHGGDSITADQAANIRSMLGECPSGTESAMLNGYGVGRVEDLPAAAIGRIVSRLEQHRRGEA